MYLEYINPKLNKYRFYAIYVEYSLFGSLILTRKWGALGSRNPVQLNQEFFEINKLVMAVKKILKLRRHHHYQLIDNQLIIPNINRTHSQERQLILLAEEENHTIHLTILGR